MILQYCILFRIAVPLQVALFILGRTSIVCESRLDQVRAGKQALQGQKFAFLATIMDDGSPQVTPVWVDTDGDYIIINTAEGRLKHKNISRDPRVAVSVLDHANPYKMVTVQGTVVEQTTTRADEQIDKMAKKYLGLDKYRAARLEKKGLF